MEIRPGAQLDSIRCGSRPPRPWGLSFSFNITHTHTAPPTPPTHTRARHSSIATDITGAATIARP